MLAKRLLSKLYMVHRISNMQMQKKEFVVSLDIGATKICCIVGEMPESGPQSHVEIVGSGIVPSTGFNKGIVTHLDATVKGITKAVEIAESVARIDISSVYIGIANPSDHETIRCANKAGLNVAEVCLQSVASGEAVLFQDEKDLGVVLIDMGGASCNIAIFKGGSIVYSAVVAIGGHQITNDIALGLRTPQVDAENIKVRQGCALTSLVKREETIEVAGVGGRKPRVLPRRLLAEIIEPRVEEIFLLIQREVNRSGYQHLLSSGAVITGGAILLEGMPELGQRILEMPVKRGFSQGVGGQKEVVSSPRFATGVGLLKYGAQNIVRARFPNQEKNIYDKVRGSMRVWIKDLF